MDATGRLRGAGVGYNLIVRFHIAVLGIAALLVCGCNKTRNIQNPEAVRQGVMDYLAKRGTIDTKSMQIDVASVNFRENEADAVVSFRPKGNNDPAAGMQMSYTLERKGDQWVVKGRAGSKGSSNPHGEGQAMPGGTGMGAQMPPAHPPMTEGAPSGSKK
jgi:hypothetical protein